MTRAVFVLTAVLLATCAGAWAQAVNACDLNADTKVNAVDVQLAIAMKLALRTCTATVAGTGVCTQTVVDRVKTAALPGGACVRSRSVELNWTHPSAPTMRYNVYRKTGSTGTYTKLNATPFTETTYMDSTVQFSTTYYYVVRAVDGSGTESANSNEAQAVIPAS